MQPRVKTRKVHKRPEKKSINQQYSNTYQNWFIGKYNRKYVTPIITVILQTAILSNIVWSLIDIAIVQHNRDIKYRQTAKNAQSTTRRKISWLITTHGLSSWRNHNHHRLGIKSRMWKPTTNLPTFLAKWAWMTQDMGGKITCCLALLALHFILH